MSLFAFASAMVLLFGSVPAGTLPASDMVVIPGGPFLMGCNNGDPDCSPDAQPARTVAVDEFEIDRKVVAQRAYEACVAAHACEWTSFPPLYPGEDRTAKGVTWFQAQAYCAWVGKRLPTEAEWEKAARGVDARVFPWGNEAPDKCPDGSGNSRGSAECAAGASPYGVLGMADSSEWVADWYDPEAPRKGSNNPSGPEHGCHRSYRGGPVYRRAYDRPGFYNTYTSSFRCARSRGSGRELAQPQPEPARHWSTCPERPTDTDQFSDELRQRERSNLLLLGLALLSLGAVPVSVLLARRRGTSFGRFAVNVGAALVGGLGVGAFTGGMTLLMMGDAHGGGAGPASLAGGMAVVLVAALFGAFGVAAGAVVGVVVAERFRTGSWPSVAAWVCGLGGFILGAGLGYLQFLADRAYSGLVADLSTLAAIPVTIASLTVAGCMLPGPGPSTEVET